MQSEIKEEPADESLGEPPLDIYFQDVGQSSQPGPSRFRKRVHSPDMIEHLRVPEVTEFSADSMNRLLQLWGLEALTHRFAEHLIDLNVLDYMLDVDIVDLCRDFPIRYRLILRHNLQNGYHKNVITGQTTQPSQWSTKRPQTIITFEKNPETKIPDTPERKKKKKKTAAEPEVSDVSRESVDPSQFVSVEDELPIRSILAREPKFRPHLNDLDKGLIPDAVGMRMLNRIITGHFFEERIVEQSDYPKKEEKLALALKILDAFPQLERTRVTPEAPKESYFFWMCGGKEKGPHTGAIEYRTTNLRREVPPEKRRYLRVDKKQTNFVLPDSIREQAARLTCLPPLPENEQMISDGMAECTDLHSCILQQGDSTQVETLVSTFPHLLSYSGKMVQQVFKRLHSCYEASAPIDKFLVLGLLLDAHAFANVENKYIRATLRIMKKLIMGVKKDESDEMSTEEAEASPLIRWIQHRADELEIYAVQRHISERSYLAPHILCMADVFREGNMYIIFQGKFIGCGNSVAHTLDVFFKLFAVFGLPVPVALRKIHELLMVYLWKVTTTCKSITVSKLMTKLEELDVFNKNDEHSDRLG